MRTTASLYFIRISAVAAAEFRGVLRSHPFRIFLPAGLFLVILSPGLVLFAFDARDSMVVQLGISTAALFSTLLGITAGATAVSADREARRQELLLAGALDPEAWLLGKWAGLSLAVLLSVTAIGAVQAVSLALRGGPPNGWGPLLAALAVAASGGSLASGIGIASSSLLRAGPAFLASLLVLLAGHAAPLAGSTPAFRALALFLPRAPDLNLAAEAAFGPFPPAVALLAGVHALAWALFAVTFGAAAVRIRSSWDAGTSPPGKT